MKFWFWYLIIFYFTVSNAAKWSELHTCNDVSFCRRNRIIGNVSDTERLVYPLRYIDRSSVQIKDTYDGEIKGEYLFAILESKGGLDRSKLLLHIVPMKGGSFRVTIKEQESSLLRFEAKDALIAPLPLQQFEQEPIYDDHQVSLWNEGNQLRLVYDPLEILVYQKGSNDWKPVIVLNYHQLLRFEVLHERSEHFCFLTNKPESINNTNHTEDIIESSVDDKEEVNAIDEKDWSKYYCDSAWEETIQGHVDRKRRGLEAVSLDVLFPVSERLYGMPERTTDLTLPLTKASWNGPVYSEPYRFYNLDVFEYEIQKPLGLYGSIPLVYALSDEKSCGCLWLNPSETFVDVFSSDWNNQSSLTTHFISETGLLDLIVFPGGSEPESVFKQYLQVTGRPAMAQRFALGYHQSRWNYRDQEDTLHVNEQLDKLNIPCDVIWLDIEHTDGKRYFTWDFEKFPNPSYMRQKIASSGRKLVTIVDPHIKVDDNYFVYKEANQRHLFIRKEDEDDPYAGWCWAGSSSYLDFVNKTVRNWWSTRFHPYHYPHFGDNLYIWIDMNEPTVFNGPENSIPKAVRHLDNWEHRQVHNMYGFYMHRATYRGLLQARNFSDRPFILSRSFFIGSHRYGAVWTGDNQAKWEHLVYSVPMILSLQMSGMILSGADVGGFFFDPDTELLVRWYELAAFQPFFRAHAHEDTKRREPWIFDSNTRHWIRKAILRRYELLPYWYTLFAAVSHSSCEKQFDRQLCGPPMRPLFWEFYQDRQTWDEQSEWMIGNALLVAPVLEKASSSRTVYLPSGDWSHPEQWFDLFTVEDKKKGLAYSGKVSVFAPLGRHVVFQRGGTIVPFRNRTRRASYCMDRDPISLRIALDKDGQATGQLYLDDGRSFLYKSGHFRLITYTWKPSGVLQVETLSHGNGSFTGCDVPIESVFIYGWMKKDQPQQVFATFGNYKKHYSFVLENQVLIISRLNLTSAPQTKQDSWKLFVV